MANSSPTYRDFAGNRNNINISPMALEFSSALNFNSNDRDNSQQRHLYNEQPQYDNVQQQQQQQQQSTCIRLPSFSSLISGTPDPLIPDYPRLYYNTPPRMSQATTHYPTPNTTTTFDSQRWSSTTDRTLSQTFMTPSTHSTYDYASSTTFPRIPTTPNEPIYLTYGQQQQQQHHPPPPLSSNNSMIDDTTVTGSSSTTTINKPPRRTRKSKFLSQVGTCVLNKRWPATTKKDRHSSGRSSNSGSLIHHNQNHRLSSTTSPTSPLIPPPPPSSSSTASLPSLAVSSTSSSSSSIVKPRWQEAERLDLLKAIVKEKHLDDMTSFSWDRISLVVGRAKKACKDQWRREVLPALMEKLK
ncbi:hypothetical protein BC941DRAFT_236300 [Chlamydoabsidia padenii]|nr:hypothetical protein BC941DRAFT_236300 [Chlamydoabsidia padenii]